MKICHILYRKSRVSTTRPEKEICRKGINQICFSNIDLKLNYQMLKKFSIYMYASQNLNVCSLKTLSLYIAFCVYDEKERGERVEI